ncbi:MAG TPA: sulfurtransferase complex subunit TusB, partial [Pseudomonas sp.]|nr:sulfurtransferase complex subunit TusB [Pseudomonas sp.]
MATLHLLSHSPFSDSRLASCLRLLGPDDGVLLSGDAVYALQPGTAQLQALELMPASIALYALDEDLQARALNAPA